MDSSVEGRESLPEPVRDKVIERARFAFNRVDIAHQQAEEAAKRAEQQVWQLEKQASRS